MRAGLYLIALVGLAAAADIIHIAQHRVCNGTVVKDTYVMNGACQVKGKSSLRQTITGTTLLTEKFSNGACKAPTPFVTKKDISQCDEKTFETYQLVTQIPAVASQAAITVYGCDQVYALSTDNSKCNSATVGKCAEDKATFCGSQRDRLVNALTTGRSVFVTGVLESIACYVPDRYRKYYTVNGGCTALRGYRYASRRRTVIGDSLTVQYYMTNNCTGVVAYTENEKPGVCNSNNEIFTFLPAFPKVKDDADVTAWVAPGCGAIEQISVENSGTCPDTGRGECTVSRNGEIYQFCGNELDFVLDAFMAGDRKSVV